MPTLNFSKSQKPKKINFIKSKRDIMLDMLEKYDNSKSYNKKLHEQVLISIVTYFSLRKEKAIDFLTYLKNYHSSRCQSYVEIANNTEDYGDEKYLFNIINNCIIAHCDEKHLFTHLWGMFQSGQATTENL